MAQVKSPTSMQEWARSGERKLGTFLRKGRRLGGLARLGPAGKSWKADLKFVGEKPMIRLNFYYRGKKRPTDILSFPSPRLFWKGGYLGELVICLPVMKRQARELGHRPEVELDVLLVHGILHLLGMDHEKNRKEAEKMARWEKKLLNRASGLIVRAHSGNSKTR